MPTIGRKKVGACWVVTTSTPVASAGALPDPLTAATRAPMSSV